MCKLNRNEDTKNGKICVLCGKLVIIGTKYYSSPFIQIVRGI